MNKSELIQGYLDKQLTQSQVAELKGLLQTDAGFKEAFTQAYELQEAIKAEERLALKSRLKTLDHPAVAKSSKLWKLAAALALLLGIGWLLTHKSSPDLQELYAQNFEPYPNVVMPAVRNSEDTTDPELREAFQFYDSRNYEAAAIAFRHIFESTNSDDAFFYYSISLMSSGHTEPAVALLENYPWQQAEKYRTLSRWYAAMGHLKLEHQEAAVAHLKAVAQAGKPLSEKAESLLKQLK